MKPHLEKLARKKASQVKMKSKISALALNKKGEVMATAFNSPRFDWYGGGNHAEMMVLKKCKSIPHTIILCRVGNSGDILPIEPCERCQKVLDKYDIKVKTVS
jgi:cytidine deaminase